MSERQQENLEQVEKVLEFYNKGEQFYNRDDLPAATSAYRSALELDNERKYSAVLHFRLGCIFAKDGAIIDAIQEYRQSLDDSPMLSAVEHARNQLVQMTSSNLGILILDMVEAGNEDFQLEEAEKHLRKALEIPVDNRELLQGARIHLETIKKMKEHGWVIIDRESKGIKKIFPASGS